MRHAERGGNDGSVASVAAGGAMLDISDRQMVVARRNEERLAEVRRDRLLRAVREERAAYEAKMAPKPPSSRTTWGASRRRSHRERELALRKAIGGNPRSEAVAHAHVAFLARRRGDAGRAGSEADLARAAAARVEDPEYAATTEANLALPAWKDARY